MLKILDKYIIKKFIGTYLFLIAMIVAIVIVFDFSEKSDKFMSNQAPMKAIFIDYYLNFVPYFLNLFSSLFTFISVIFFTSKLADNSEIIAMLSSGVSLKRLMRPFMIAALFIAVANFMLSSFIIPPSNIKWLRFQDKYIEKTEVTYASNKQLQVEPGVIAYFERYDNAYKMGYNFSLDHFEGQTIKSRMTAQRIQYDTLNRWKAYDYLIREMDGMEEKITRGAEIDTLIRIQPSDFLIAKGDQSQMTTPELATYIVEQQMRGVGNITDFEIEFHRRFAESLSAFILTIIGVSLSARKIKGGMGLNIGIGLALSFAYILFSTIATGFATSGGIPIWLAVWLPNILFSFIAYYVYIKKAPR